MTFSPITTQSQGEGELSPSEGVGGGYGRGGKISDIDCTLKEKGKNDVQQKNCRND